MTRVVYPPFGAGSLANPTASVGLAAVNGTALTAMRSDAAPALASTIVAGGPTGSATVVPIITYNAAGQLTTVSTATITQPSGANPTASVGLSAVNGSAPTFMRSDGAPALDQTAAFAFSGLAATTISQVAANATNFTITAATQTTNTTANPTISITRTNAVGAGNSAPAVLFVNLTNTSGSTGNKIFDFQTGGTTMLNLTVGGALVGSNDWTTAGQMQVGAAQRYTIGTDLILSRAGAARLRLGTSDAASPVAQQLEVQNAITGNNNGAATFTVVGPLSVGNGTSGDTVFSTGKNGNGSGVLATITEALRIKGETQAVVVASGKTFQIGNAAVTGLTPGVFAATTDATIVITDANGQAYRVAAKI